VIEAPNRNGTRVAAADSNPAQLTDRKGEDPNGSPGLAIDAPTITIVKPSRFSPLLDVIAVLASAIIRSKAFLSPRG
jgi:hypothetical protein